MCGIVGYIGEREAFPILINGLRRLEYHAQGDNGAAVDNPRLHPRTYTLMSGTSCISGEAIIIRSPWRVRSS